MRNCPACGSPASIVADSRHTSQSTRRRRECHGCGERWTTYEVSAAAFLALTEIDALLESAAAGVREVADKIATVRAEARQVRDDYGVTHYRPVRDGSAMEPVRRS